MCGINGIVRLSLDAPPVDRGELERTRDAMAARGPDGLGLWLSPRNDAGLGHRRLAIIDLSEAAAQPMTSSDGRYVIVFNGEIYNYRDLRADLERQGHGLRSQSDTEVLLALYARDGTAMFPKLRGMYAFAIWDERERHLLLARDPYGIKPLYYSEHRGVLRFASQVKALEAAGTVPLDLDPAGLVGFLLWGSVPEPLTLRRSIRAVPAGHFVEVKEGRVLPPRAHFRFEDPPPTEGIDVIAALDDSIRAHLVSDVPVGVFLSAGLDSALITALMRRHLPEPPRTFTLAFDEFAGTPLDEGPGAAGVARVFGTQHEERRLMAEARRDLWPETLRAMDQPSVDGSNVFLMSRFAREAGLKVVLSGLGGDEIFGSYPSFSDVPRWARWARLGARLPGLAAAWPRVARTTRGSRPKMPGFLRYGPTLPGSYFLRRGLFLPEEIPLLLDPDTAAEGLAAYDPVADVGRCLESAAGSINGWASVHLMESSHYLRNQLLRDADWASMAHSLELRVPLVDSRLREALAAARFEPARNHGKAVLVSRAVPELPESVLRRSKSGFMVPVAPMLLGLHAGRQPWGRQARWLAQEVLKGFQVEIEIGALSGRRPARGRGHPCDKQTGGTLLLLTEVFHRPGGIQSYHRDQVQAILRCESGEPLSALVLNDSQQEVQRKEWWGLRAEGFSRQKLRFAWRSMEIARRQRPRRIIIGHRNFLLLAPVLRLVAPRSSRWLLSYGIETQRRLTAIERACVRSVDRAFAISPQTADALREAGHGGSVDLWPCSLPFSWELPEPAPAVFANPYRLLTVARLAPPDRYKGIDDTIRAVARLLKAGTNVTLDVAGEGEDLARLQGIARDSGVGASVFFHGRVGSDALRRLYSSCDVFVLPSGAEGFGIVYLEALAYGKPVVAAAAGGAPYVVRPDVSGFLVPYGNTDALADCIAERIAKPEETRALGEKGRRFLQDTFSFRALVERTREILARGAP